jgi:hypothetical protein
VFGKPIANSTLPDARALYNSTDANDLGAGAALSLTTLGDGCGAMFRQKTAAGNELGIWPSFLVVKPEMKFLALSLVKQLTIEGNPAALEVVVSNEITNAAWYLFADPTLAPVIALSTLRGTRSINIRNGVAYRSSAPQVAFDHAFGTAVLSRVGTIRGGV